jgi:hypothetical protein
MQILSELEPVPRGASMGAIGYFAWHDGQVDEMEWSVAIRTATIIENRATFHKAAASLPIPLPQAKTKRCNEGVRAVECAEMKPEWEFDLGISP